MENPNKNPFEKLTEAIDLNAELDQALAGVAAFAQLHSTYYQALRADGISATVALDLTKYYMGLMAFGSKGST